jgi:hypothetical protein
LRADIKPPLRSSFSSACFMDTITLDVEYFADVLFCWAAGKEFPEASHAIDGLVGLLAAFHKSDHGRPSQ